MNCTDNLILLSVALIGMGLVLLIATIVAIARCHKNKGLTRSQKWAWQLAHCILLFPSFIYLIVVDKSRSWKIFGIMIFITASISFYFVMQNLSCGSGTYLRDLGSGGVQMGDWGNFSTHSFLSPHY